jgi:hypothetical protein
VCGRTSGKQQHKETWWWNDEVAAVIREKRRLYRIYDKSKKGSDQLEMEENKRRYNEAKRTAKKAVSKAQEVERKKFGKKLDEEDGKGNVFRVAKQLVRKNRDVVGEGCIKDTDGKIVVEDDKLMEVWRAYYDKLSN